MYVYCVFLYEHVYIHMYLYMYICMYGVYIYMYISIYSVSLSLYIHSLHIHTYPTKQLKRKTRNWALGSIY